MFLAEAFHAVFVSLAHAKEFSDGPRRHSTDSHDEETPKPLIALAEHDRIVNENTISRAQQSI
jgi:hypothetical protein